MSKYNVHQSGDLDLLDHNTKISSVVKVNISVDEWIAFLRDTCQSQTRAKEDDSVCNRLPTLHFNV